MRFLRKSSIVLVVLLLFLLSFCVILAVRANAIITDTSTAEINARINDIINESNTYVMGLKVFYSDFFTLQYDKDGNVSTVIANTGLINQITLLWNTEIQQKLNELREIVFTFKAGFFTGSAFLSGYGIDMTVHAHTISNCAITYSSVFLNAGINQTLHRLILYTEVRSEITVPTGCDDVVVTQEMVLAENVINGKVPDAYLLGENSTNYLDLLP